MGKPLVVTLLLMFSVSLAASAGAQQPAEGGAAADKICLAPVINRSSTAVPAAVLMDNLLTWLDRKKLAAAPLTAPAEGSGGPSDRQRQQAAELGCNSILVTRIFVASVRPQPLGTKAPPGNYKVTGTYSLYRGQEQHSAPFEYSDTGAAARVVEESMRAVADEVKSFLDSERKKKR